MKDLNAEKNIWKVPKHICSFCVCVCVCGKDVNAKKYICKVAKAHLVFIFLARDQISFWNVVVEYSLQNDPYTVDLQWLEHWWLVYHGCFELVLECLGKKNHGGRSEIIKGDFLFLFKVVYCVYSLESPRWGDSNENIQYTFILKEVENKTLYYMHNKEIPWFPNKLKVIITSGLGRFISSKKIFPSSRFYFSNTVRIYKRGNIWVTLTWRLGRSQQRSECKTLDLKALWWIKNHKDITI